MAGLLPSSCSLHADVPPIPQCKSKRSIIDPIQKFFFDQMIKVCLISRKDIAKECVKLILPLCIRPHYKFIRDYAIDYGCEAAWAGFYDGVNTVPAALLKHALVDACYHQLHEAACYCNIDYPREFKSHATVYNLTRALVPLIIKRLLGNCIENICNEACDCDDQESELVQY